MNHVALIAGGGADETLAEIRRRGIPGYAVDVLATADGALTPPFAQHNYDLIHVWSPPAAITPGSDSNVPLAATYDDTHPASFYHRSKVVFSPHRAADARLEELGLTPERIVRWHRGVDAERFSPRQSQPGPRPFTVIHAGAPNLLTDALLIARNHVRHLQAVPASQGLYATADLLVLTPTDEDATTRILEAQASGLPVLAVDTPIATELIESGRTGCLVPSDPIALAGAITGLARRATLRRRLAAGGLLAARERTWGRSLADLAAGYERALGPASQAEIANAA
jgi:Glycosyl transferases group 1